MELQFRHLPKGECDLECRNSGSGWKKTEDINPFSNLKTTVTRPILLSRNWSSGYPPSGNSVVHSSFYHYIYWIANPTDFPSPTLENQHDPFY